MLAANPIFYIIKPSNIRFAVSDGKMHPSKGREKRKLEFVIRTKNALKEGPAYAVKD
jgi:hypothetical protein